MPKLVQALKDVPELADVNSDQQEGGLETQLTIDRATAARLGITTQQVDSTLYDAFGQRQVSTIYNPLNQYHVVMEVAPEFWQSPDSLAGVYVRTAAGAQVPLLSFSRYAPGSAAMSVNHQGEFAASTLSFNLAPGKSLSDGTRIIRDAMNRIGMPASIHGSFQGTAKAF